MCVAEKMIAMEKIMYVSLLEIKNIKPEFDFVKKIKPNLI